jgi:hypothetical protein
MEEPKMSNAKGKATLKAGLALGATLLGAAAFRRIAYAATPITLSTQKVTVDSREVELNQYTIEKCNYVSLRDLAMALNGTSKQFSIGWDDASNTVKVILGGRYAPAGIESAKLTLADIEPVKSDDSILVNGKKQSLSVFKINGSNYFKLKDIAEALGVTYAYDPAKNTVALATRAVAAATPKAATTTATPAAAATPKAATTTATPAAAATPKAATTTAAPATTPKATTTTATTPKAATTTANPAAATPKAATTTATPAAKTATTTPAATSKPTTPIGAVAAAVAAAAKSIIPGAKDETPASKTPTTKA